MQKQFFEFFFQFDANKLYSTYSHFSHIHSFVCASIVFQHMHNQKILSQYFLTTIENQNEATHNYLNRRMNTKYQSFSEKMFFKREKPKLFPKNKFLGHQFRWHNTVTYLISAHEKIFHPFWSTDTTGNQGKGRLTFCNSGYRELVGSLNLPIHRHNAL